MSEWRPSADIMALGRRAQLLSEIRQFFAARGVLEVDTPLLASAPVTDPNIEAITAQSPSGMKRLLAAGSGPIYQICKAFRRGERGRRHNPEFTMLEWYRPGMSLDALIDEVVAVITLASGSADVALLTYQKVFELHCHLNPHTASLAELKVCARRHLDLGFDSDDRDLWLQLLMSSVVEPALDPAQISIVYDFPETQAALAKIAVNGDGHPVARRFEAFFAGMELANGYDELRDANELVRRIGDDHRRRGLSGQDLPPIDRYLLKAMPCLPECTGVAIGFDRLVMIACKAERIDQVIAFPLERV